MRLSFGFVRGNQIACLYHGWHYDSAGQCRYIPAHPQLTPPDTIKVPVFESAERLGMIWVRNGGSPDGEPPEDRAVTEVRSITVECSPEHAVSGLLAGDAAPAVLSPALVSVKVGDDEIIAGVQPLSAGECVLHLVVANAVDAAARKRVSTWAEEMRRSLEETAPQVAEAAE
jgi:hypothetical protein